MLQVQHAYDNNLHTEVTSLLFVGKGERTRWHTWPSRERFVGDVDPTTVTAGHANDWETPPFNPVR